MVVLNFITLAGVSFSVYSVQLMLHPGHTSLDFAFYEGSLAGVYILLAVQYFYGWIVRRRLLPAAVAERGLRVTLMLFGVGIAFAAVAVVTLRYGVRVSGLQHVGYIVLLYAIALRVSFGFGNLRRLDRVPAASTPTRGASRPAL